MRKANNKGYLINITVIVMIVVSFIVTGCIAIVMANWNMKRTERNIQTNYYSAEMALDDIRAGVEMFCSEDIENAYSILISSVNTVPYDELNKEFKKIYVDNLERRFNTENLKKTLSACINPDSLKKEEEGKNYGLTFVSDPELDLSLVDEGKVYLRNIGVSYISSNNVYLSRIFTDIEITIPQIYNSMSSEGEASTNFTEYALIADNSIEFNQESIEVNGGIYAGEGGILIGKSGVVNNCNLVSNNVVTRGDIKLYKGSKLKINGLNDKASQIYVNNLIVTKEGTHDSYSENTEAVNIKGDLYVREDTLLNAKNTKFILDGNYYGYHVGSSAFCINGVGATADLSNAKTLWIAGTSYIDINSVVNESSDVLMGESLTYKGTQSMYLMPSVCLIDKEKHETISNPLPFDYMKDGVLDDSKCEVRIEENKENGGIDLTAYLDKNNAYKTVVVNENGVRRVYVYLNFTDKFTASKYADEYSSYNKDYMDDRANAFSLGNIVLGKDTSLRTVGNVVSYDGKNITVNKGIMTNSNDFITYKDSYFTNKYNSMVSTLQEHKTSIKNNSLFDFLINREAIIKDAEANRDGVHNTVPSSDAFICDDVAFYDPDINGYKVLIAAGDVKIRNNFKGIVITTGNVYFINGVSKVIGLILSGESIGEQNGSSFNTSSKCEFSATDNGDYPILYLLYEWSERHGIYKYFNTLGNTNSSSVNNYAIKSTVKFRNWVTE